MADNKKADTKKFDTAVKALIKAYKPKKEITNDELVDKIVKPFELKDEEINDLMQKVEDQGISIVDEDGNPSAATLKKEKVSAKELKDMSDLLVLRLMIQCGCT